MVEIKSNKSIIKKSDNQVFDYLSVPANYEVLMPSKVRSFAATADMATLDIEGIGKVELAIVDKTEPFLILMKPQNRVPFAFEIQWNVQAISDTETAVEAIINADLNFMMKMMAEKLLQDFLNVQVYKLAEHLND